ncbi:tyrosine-protein kinase RYK [Elysia marginata]|uniref:receptor protein-tyrosine kinase n=1 Tax=Elysia marginata TaxID=1093978 RepID=A0AAV4IN13_9GAST|nr:tyrosine-protein kinase RYK [Elysia marginata]
MHDWHYNATRQGRACHLAYRNDRKCQLVRLRYTIKAVNSRRLAGKWHENIKTLRANSVWVPREDLYQIGGRAPDLSKNQGHDPGGGLKGFQQLDPFGRIRDGIRDVQKRLNNATLTQPGEGGDSDDGVTTSNHIFYVAVACACSVIILIALSVTIFYITSQRRTDRFDKKVNCYENSSSQALTGQSQTFLRPDTPNNASGSGVSSIIRRGMSPSLDLKPTDVHTVLSDALVDRKRITLGELLMEGTFGRIYTGTLLTLDETDSGPEQEVYVKTVTDQANPDQVHLFLTESVLLKGLAHPNLHSLIGACMAKPEQPLVAYPAMQEGNMKKFLLKCRMAETGSRYTLNTQQLVYMTIQIIRGIQYLHRKKLIHKDVATRNCIVGAELAVRLTDNSLARDLFPADYNCLGDNENRPVKWMALEALTHKRFSPATDVWAFGVTLWEMMTLGQQPYAEVDPFEMPSYLQEGYRIAKPHNCPDELFSLMACCWALSPDERPKFPQLLTYLQNFYMALGRYV